MSRPTPQSMPRPIGTTEFIILMALMTSLSALSTDAMLPALPIIGSDLGVSNINDTQLVLSALFLGLAIGQMFYGPISDSTGRKPMVYVGFGLFVIGCLMSIYAENFTIMLIGRLLQGFGIAGPRTVSVAIIRDQYSGNDMARIMSYIMAVFIIGPVVAPSIGQGVLIFAHWQMIFTLLMSLSIFVCIWFTMRQSETLPVSARSIFSFFKIKSAVIEVCKNRQSLGYTLVGSMVFGSLIGYLTSAQQIFQVRFELGNMFPVYFGIMAMSVGVASVFNGKLVHRFGMFMLSLRAMQLMILVSILTLAIIAYMEIQMNQNLPFWIFMIWGLVAFLCLGFLFSNVNALAMEPLGHIAGTGASVIGSLTTFISLILGTLIGQAYDGTTIPMIAGFAVLGVIGLLIMVWVESKQTETK